MLGFKMVKTAEWLDLQERLDAALLEKAELHDSLTAASKRAAVLEANFYCNGRVLKELDETKAKIVQMQERLDKAKRTETLLESNLRCSDETSFRLDKRLQDAKAENKKSAAEIGRLRDSLKRLSSEAHELRQKRQSSQEAERVSTVHQPEWMNTWEKAREFAQKLPLGDVVIYNGIRYEVSVAIKSLARIEEDVTAAEGKRR